MWELKLQNVTAEDPEGAVYTTKHNVVIMAGGPLSQPKLPEGVDLGKFQGTQFHSQKWRHDVSLGMIFPAISWAIAQILDWRAKIFSENKRVAVVGNGCSATQFMPIVGPKTTLVMVQDSNKI